MFTLSMKTEAPSKNKDFDKVYKSWLLPWVWSDTRIPWELKELVETCNPENVLELGCGLGYFSSFMAKQGVKATGVDFSAAAIEKAKKRVANENPRPTFMVGDVTNLEMLSAPFDASYDVGCFHCLDKEGQQKYVSEVCRLLKPGGTHLIWAFDHSPGKIDISPDYMAQLFNGKFFFKFSSVSQRRMATSHWYWLVKK
jgi:cyclopropane fatty-acyl-phospholipid synthase-like methyltransferase